MGLCVSLKINMIEPGPNVTYIYSYPSVTHPLHTHSPQCAKCENLKLNQLKRT